MMYCLSSDALYFADLYSCLSSRPGAVSLLDYRKRAQSIEVTHRERAAVVFVEEPPGKLVAELTLDALVELPHVAGGLVRAEETVPPHEDVAIVIDERLVVHVVVCRGAEPEPPEQRVPWVRRLRVDEDEPGGPRRPERHVLPHVRVYQLRRDEERHQDHREGVAQAAVEGIEKPRVCKAMVGLVGALVELCAEPLVLEPVHGVLQRVLANHLCGDDPQPNAAVKAVVRARHQIEHPRGRQVDHEHRNAARLLQVRLHPLGKRVRPRIWLDAEKARCIEPNIVVEDHKHLSDESS
mmetsp:Transcript_12395/g.26821  ORF Transcript_12395/g.26821 Transcript_12395/m.26821 type:complete len:295 (-) Transcript_12395:273-1157(-)